MCVVYYCIMMRSAAMADITVTSMHPLYVQARLCLSTVTLCFSRLNLGRLCKGGGGAYEPLMTR